MTENAGTEGFTDAERAVWEPLIAAVRPRGETPPKDLRCTIAAVFWRHQNGAKGAPKGGTAESRDQREALGRSRGGFGTKAVAVADSQGRAFALAPGQAHETPIAPVLLDALPDAPGWGVGDRGLSSDRLRGQTWDMGARPAIPAQRNEAPVRCPDFVHVHRNRSERLWGRLKKWRAVATRYEKTARSFQGRALPRRRAGLAQTHHQEQAIKS